MTNLFVEFEEYIQGLTVRIGNEYAEVIRQKDARIAELEQKVADLEKAST